MRTEGHIAIAGAGYVGLTSAACFCKMGHQVRLVEIDPTRLTELQSGQCPIYEPGLPELLAAHLGKGLQITDQLTEAIRGATALFVCVGTPPTEGGKPDLRALTGLLTEAARVPAIDRTIVVLKSTVPPGTNRLAHDLLGKRVQVVSNPEFLREGTAIADFFQPDRVIVGSPDEEAALKIAGLYLGVDAPLLVTGWEEAELIKYATNAFLAVKISFANEVAAICDQLGTEAPDVLKGLGLDHRVGPHFLRPGPGYGGSCLPKDVQALLYTAQHSGVGLDLIPAAERANARQRDRLLTKLRDHLGELHGKRVAVWGLTFKAGTDDLRGSAAVDLVPRLLTNGAAVRVYDPVGMPNFARLFPPEEWPGLALCDDPWSALQGADALLILTEWDIFAHASPLQIRRRMTGRLVVDGRNLLDPEQSARTGLIYQGVGRGRRRRT
jgi:UDPglucose 6-dehydrogenase